MVGNICPLQCRQEHPPPPPKNSCRGHFLFANDAKCVQVSHVKFSLPLNGQLGWKKKKEVFSRLSSTVSIFLWPAKEALRPMTDRPFRSCPCQWDRGAWLMVTIGAFIWDHKYFHGTKPGKPWSVTTPSLPVVSPLFYWIPFFFFAFQKCTSSELSFHLGVYESRRYLLSLLNTQRPLAARRCVDWRMPSGPSTFLMFLKAQSTYDGS